MTESCNWSPWKKKICDECGVEFSALEKNKYCVQCIDKRKQELIKKSKERAKIRRKEWLLKPENRLTERIYRTKASAKKRGIIFSLSSEFVLNLIKKQCFYCDIGIEEMGIDRIDSKQGYIEGNVVPCCKMCNTMKWTSDIDSFFSKIKKIAINHKLNLT